jgi:hypothetical protein
MDVTRATQLGTWSGWLETPDGRVELGEGVLGTKDRSWGIRPVGEPLPGPSPRAPQLCFFWAPLHFDDGGLHFMTFDDAEGRPISRSAARMPLVGETRRAEGSLRVTMMPGTRWMREAALIVDDQEVALTPLLRFQMRGAGYSHPQFGHGRRHRAPVVAGEVLVLDELDPLDFSNVHVQHVVRARRGDEVGIGVLEQFVIGPYGPNGLTELLDGG